MYQNLFIRQMPGLHHYKGKLPKFISTIVDFSVSSPGGMAIIQTLFDLCPHVPIFNLCPLALAHIVSYCSHTAPYVRIQLLTVIIFDLVDKVLHLTL